jgi:hypothetical protein
MQPHLRQVMGHFKAKLVEEPEVAIGFSGEVFNENGDLVDPQAIELVQTAVHKLIAQVPINS